jgi:integrase
VPHVGHNRGVAWAEKLPSGRYRGLYRDAHGKKRSVGETFTHKARAERAAATVEAKVRRSLWSDPDAARRTWGEWADEWWPTRSVAGSTERVDKGRRSTHLDPRWGDVPIGSIRRHDIKEWAAAMRRRGTGASTIQRAVHLLSASLAAAVDAEILDANPAARIDLPKGGQAMERYLTKEEFAAAVNELPTTHDQLVAYVLAYTGLRWGEMAGLHHNRLDLDRGLIAVVETFDEKNGTIKPYPKGKRARHVPVPGWLVEMLTELPQPKRGARCGLTHLEGTCRSSLVLTTESGTVMRNSNWADIWRDAVERADIGHCRPHDLRHTYASWLIQNGVELAEVGRLMGHVSTQTTAKYAHLGDTPTDAVMAALGTPFAVLPAPASIPDLAAPDLPHAALDKPSV